mmetsp:Transcript_24435/g.52819  ORF Transcript_24435/g.52819 Transcript_24435/m.52819 type:complete len:814 (-) Transcript_24435:132-2573(-)
MAPLSDRKRPFEEEEGFLPLSPPSSSFQPRRKSARLPLFVARVVNNSSSSSDKGSIIGGDSGFLSKGEGKIVAGNHEVIDLLGVDDNRSDDGTEFVKHEPSNNPNDDEVKFVKEIKPKKSVRFSEIEHEVCYFKRDPMEQMFASIDENEQASINSSGMRHPSSEHSRATADFTVISSHHGRARRSLRRISKHDLRAAVKYGKKVSAHPNIRTGEHRWKFVHNGLVYITDSTCTREITSYKEAITIDPYPMSIPMMEHHTELKRILNEEPYLCTGHTFVIIDQSGSMRNSDVDGFKSRSHAAYGTLSLEFIAQQLSQRPNQNDLFAESVTVIEMKEEPTAIFERIPFDWILFNRLLKRPNIARPSYGGNYNESLTLVKEMILEEYNNLLEDGAEQEELPNFSLVFLSDGKPSDCNPGHARERTEILKSLVDSLKGRFSCYAMGIGAPETEFEVLQSMVDTVKVNGGSGQFVHAGTSTVKLSQTFSQISSTMTSNRTTLLGEENIPTVNKGPKVQKDFTMRETGKTVGKKMPSDKFIVGKGYTINRFRFDIAAFENKREPWRWADFANYGANGLEIESKPFGKGSERLAYRFHEIKQDVHGCKRVGKTMVAKNSVHLIERETKEAFHQDFCLVQATAYNLAEKYNTAVRTSPLLKSTTEEAKPPELRFLLCHVYTITNDETKEEKGYLVEKMLPGKFTKYNSNNGYVKGVSNGDNNTHTIELASGRVKLEEFIQSFSHWVYEHTAHKMIVCDLQGVLNKEGRFPEYLLTDPAICTRKGQRYGKTDMRLNGIRKFCMTHRCGPVCQGLGLPPMNKC